MMVVIGMEREDGGEDKAPRTEGASELSVELACEAEITERLNDLASHEERAREVGMSLPDYMGGKYTSSSGKVVESAAHFKDSLSASGVIRMKARHAGVKSIAEMGYSEEEDPPQFTPEQLLGRHKFYLSLGEGEGNHSPADLRQQQLFLENLIIAASNMGIDISWKVEEHGYDMPDVYTSQPDALRDLIVTMYNSDHYPKSMWNDVPRVFQGDLGGGVSSQHIGMVQEPSTHGVRTIGSHSVRMQKLGEVFEGQLALGTGRRQAFEGACEAVGVRPDAPWLLNDSAAREFRDGVAAK